jgi:hypothetical protein
MGRTKALALNLVVLSVAFAVALLVAEGAVRLLPNSVTGRVQSLPLAPDRYTAFKLEPSRTTEVRGACYSATVRSNSAGFRDSEWQGAQDIVVLGDSFMEAQQVSDGAEFASLLEDRLAVPVANLGIASFNTVAELASYEGYGRALEPRIVLLALYLGNDIDGNTCAGKYRPDGTLSMACGQLSDGVVTYPTNFYSLSGNHVLRGFLREHCALCRMAQNARTRASVTPTGTANRAQDALYLPQGTAGTEIEDSWHITKETLKRLQTTVADDGARLIVITVPGYIDYAPESLAERAAFAPLPSDFSVTEPHQRLEALLTELGVEHLSLVPAFTAYRDTHALTHPYFSFTCDGHWNELGHRVAADAVAAYLQGQSN